MTDPLTPDANVYYIMAVCNDCGAAMSLKENRYSKNKFLGCSAYPDCSFTIPYDSVLQSLSERILELEKQLEGSETPKNSTPRSWNPVLHSHLKPVADADD